MANRRSPNPPAALCCRHLAGQFVGYRLERGTPRGASTCSVSMRLPDCREALTHGRAAWNRQVPLPRYSTAWPPVPSLNWMRRIDGRSRPECADAAHVVTFAPVP
jgi:hypothetical protein